jgi:hypothetical protein
MERRQGGAAYAEQCQQGCRDVDVTSRCMSSQHLLVVGTPHPYCTQHMATAAAALPANPHAPLQHTATPYSADYSLPTFLLLWWQCWRLQQHAQRATSSTPPHACAEHTAIFISTPAHLSLALVVALAAAAACPPSKIYYTRPPTAHSHIVSHMLQPAHLSLAPSQHLTHPPLFSTRPRRKAHITVRLPFLGSGGGVGGCSSMPTRQSTPSPN